MLPVSLRNELPTSCAITAFTGLLVTAANGFLKPARSLLLAAVLTVAYLLINGLLLFGRGGLLVGEQRRLWIPEELAYRGVEGRPAGMLVFDVELIKIE